MSKENVELFYRAHDAFNRRDIDAFLRLCDPKVEFVSGLAELEGGGSYHGHDGVRAWLKNILAVFPDFRTEVDEVRDFGDVTLARLSLRGHGAESHAATEATQWQITKWRRGQAIWWHSSRSKSEALEAAGVRE